MTEAVAKKVTKSPKWAIKQDDYLELLKSIDTNAKTINALMHDVKRIKTRMGL